MSWTDFIDDFLTLTSGAVSPPAFRLWSAIALVAGALERRVWVNTSQGEIYPNLYTLLVAPPGVGKYIVEEVRDIWSVVKRPNSTEFAFHVAPDSMTKAALLDVLAKSPQTFLPPKGPAIQYHSLLVAAEELEVLLPEYDREFTGVLNSIYNNKPMHRENRRHGPVRELTINFPQLNILAGAQPAYMASRFPEDVWATGLSRRIMMIYAGEGVFQELFDAPRQDPELLLALIGRLGQVSKLYGPCQFEVGAAAELALWNREGCKPVPEHSKLQNYNRERKVRSVKFATISAIARSGKPIITLADVVRGRNWMLEAELVMPDIFREMIGKSDMQVYEEAHYFVTALWAKRKQKPVSGEVIMEFLLQRVPTEKAMKIMEGLERANYLQRVAGQDGWWVPRPKIEARGVE